MNIIIKILDRITKDMLLIEEVFVKDINELEIAIKKARNKVGFQHRFEVAPK